MSRFDQLLAEKEIFLRFMNEKYHIFFNSNIFLRDIQYGIKSFFEKKDVFIKYPEAEELMKKLTERMENEGELIKLNHNTWKVNFSLNEPETEETKEEEKVES